MSDLSKSSNWPHWFDPRHKKLGSWAFILNRITAIGLTIYLCMHMVVLGKLAQGPQAYDAFIALAKTPLIKTGEMLVIAAGIIHGLNGIRVGLTSFGIAVRHQKALFIGLMLCSAILIFFFGYKMFLEG